MFMDQGSNKFITGIFKQIVRLFLMYSVINNHYLTHCSYIVMIISQSAKQMLPAHPTL